MLGKSEKLPSLQSMLSLTALVFLMSDVQGGVGPFLTVYLRGYLHWDIHQIGIALAALNLVTVISQIPSGMLIDHVDAKRLLIAFSSGLIVLGCIMINHVQTLIFVVIAQAMIGIATSMISPAINAITLGLVGREYFPKRVSINGTFNHAGNVFTAMVTALMAEWLGIEWILYVVMVFCIMSLIPLYFIRGNEIDNQVARELPNVLESNSTFKPIAKSKLLTHKPIIYFCISVLLFQFSNAAQLPLIGDELAKVSPQHASLFMASSIVLAQVVMILVAYSLGFVLEKVRRKPLFITALTILMIRALLYIFIHNAYVLLSLQVLDGLASGIYSITALVMISELGKDTGRFNFLQGVVALWVGVGAALSNFVGGYLAKMFGFNNSFLFLALIALLAIIIFQIFMPETKNIDQTKSLRIENITI